MSRRCPHQHNRGHEQDGGHVDRRSDVDEAHACII
jgi:hypothetical protein